MNLWQGAKVRLYEDDAFYEGEIERITSTTICIDFCDWKEQIEVRYVCEHLSVIYPADANNYTVVFEADGYPKLTGGDVLVIVKRGTVVANFTPGLKVPRN